MNPLTVQAILLDIEGTTSSIAFVYDVMFPFARQHVLEFLESNRQRPDVQEAIEQLAIDAGYANTQAWSVATASSDISSNESNAQPSPSFLAEQTLSLMDSDSKSTGLKALQGLIWQSGFESGELRSHLFKDVLPSLERWSRQSKAIGIYSSGSIVAQKLFFGHTPQGDLRPYFVRHYDTTIGPKRDSASYARIAVDFGLAPDEILFLSDVAGELEAATAAGMLAIAVVRPGNAALPESYRGPRIESFEELLLS